MILIKLYCIIDPPILCLGHGLGNPVEYKADCHEYPRYRHRCFERRRLGYVESTCFCDWDFCNLPNISQIIGASSTVVPTTASITRDTTANDAATSSDATKVEASSAAPYINAGASSIPAGIPSIFGTAFIASPFAPVICLGSTRLKKSPSYAISPYLLLCIFLLSEHLFFICFYFCECLLFYFAHRIVRMFLKPPKINVRVWL